MAEKPTLEQIENLERILAKIETTKARLDGVAGQTTERIKNAGDLIGGIYSEILQSLDEAYGKQLEFLSAAELGSEVQIRLIEREKQEREKLIAVQNERLDMTKRLLAEAENFAKMDKRRKEDLDDVREKIKEINDEIAAQTSKGTVNQKQIDKLNEKLERQKEKEESIRKIRERTSEDLGESIDKVVATGIAIEDIGQKTGNTYNVSRKLLEKSIESQKLSIENQQ